MIPFGSPFTIELPTKGPTKLFSHPRNSDVFLSISPEIICLWNRAPVHLLSYHIRSEPVFKGLADWDDERPLIKVKLLDGTTDTFRMHQCPSQFPIDGPKPTKFFLVYESNQRQKQGSFISTELQGIIDGDDMALQEYYHSDAHGWVALQPAVNIPKSFCSVSFDPSRQLLAFIADAKLDVLSIKPHCEELAWSITAPEGSSCCFASDRLVLLGDGKISFYNHIGELQHERTCEKGTSLLALDNEVVIATESELQVIPVAISKDASLDFMTGDHQAFLFRRDLLLPPSLRWETLDLETKYDSIKSSPDGNWLCAFNSKSLCGFGLYRRLTAKWRHDTNISISKVEWLPRSKLMIALSSTPHSNNVLILNPDQELSTHLHKIELYTCRILYFGVASLSDHLIVIFEDMSVHLYKISSVGPSKVKVEFVLNLSLGTENCLMSRWQVDLFQRQSLSSPSETDLTGGTVSRVDLENLIFLQGDTLFTVLLRPQSQTTTTATIIEQSGVDRFFIADCGEDVWLVTVHKGKVKMRRWPFASEADFYIDLAFPVAAFYPDLIPDGVLIGLASAISSASLSVSDTKMLAPSMILFYLEQDEIAACRALFQRSSNPGLLMEYLLIELVSKTNRLKAAQLLSRLHQSIHLITSKTLFREALIRASRKVDVSDAKWLFSCTSSVESLFSECLSEADLETASSLLVLRLVLGEEQEMSSEQKFPILNLLDLALEREEYQIISGVRSFIRTLWSSASDLDLVDGAVRVHAKQLVRSHRWIAFMALSHAWSPQDTGSLFDDCFGKIPSERLLVLINEIGIESRIAAVYAQLDTSPPTVESVRREAKSRLASLSATPRLRTDSAISIHGQFARSCSIQPVQVSISPGSLTMPIEETTEAERVIQFLDSFQELRQEALLWRIILYADPEAIKVLSSDHRELAVELKMSMAGHPSLSWMVARF